jgi:hypothetical protein
MNATVGADSEGEEDVADVEEALAKLDPGDEGSNRLRRRLLLRRFWKGAFGFWGRGKSQCRLALCQAGDAGADGSVPRRRSSRRRGARASSASIAANNFSATHADGSPTVSLR